MAHTLGALRRRPPHELPYSCPATGTGSHSLMGQSPFAMVTMRRRLEKQEIRFAAFFDESRLSSNGPKFDMEKAARPERDGPPAE